MCSQEASLTLEEPTVIRTCLQLEFHPIAANCHHFCDHQSLPGKDYTAKSQATAEDAQKERMWVKCRPDRQQ